MVTYIFLLLNNSVHIIFSNLDGKIQTDFNIDFGQSNSWIRQRQSHIINSYISQLHTSICTGSCHGASPSQVESQLTSSSCCFQPFFLRYKFVCESNCILSVVYIKTPSLNLSQLNHFISDFSFQHGGLYAPSQRSKTAGPSTF